MKKIVCEVCESQKIRKENGFFVCQECGTEYSLQEIKNLFQEVDENSSNINTENKILPNMQSKYILLENLKNWLVLVSSFENITFWIGNNVKVEDLTSENSFLLMKNNIRNSSLTSFPILTHEKIGMVFLPNNEPDSFKQFYGGYENIKNAILNNPIISNAYNLFRLYANEQCIVNGKMYDSYMFFLNGNFYRGIPFKNLYNFPQNWHLFIIDQKKGIKFVAADTTVHKGFFGDIVSNHILQNLDASQFITTLDNLYIQLIERNNNLKAFYEKNFEIMKQNYIELILQLEELVDVFDLPMKYRNRNDIYLLIQYIKDGRVDNWKEAINLLELEKHQQKLILKFDDLNLAISNLSSIINKELHTTNAQLSNISDKLLSINYKMIQSSYALTQIMHDTRLNLIWNN